MQRINFDYANLQGFLPSITPLGSPSELNLDVVFSAREISSAVQHLPIMSSPRNGGDRPAHEGRLRLRYLYHTRGEHARRSLAQVRLDGGVDRQDRVLVLDEVAEVRFLLLADRGFQR